MDAQGEQGEEFERVVEVLHLEDDDADGELIQRVLGKSGLRVTIRRVDSERALRGALQDRIPDVILADYRLPTFDGIRALRLVRELAPDVPFIFVSGSLGEERAVEALREGASDYILKDRPSRLPAAITRALRERDEQRARARAEAAVAESEQRFRYAALATRDVIFELDPRRGEVHVNDPHRRIWGHEQAGKKLEWWVVRVHPEDRTRIMDALGAWLASRDERWVVEFRFQRGDGEYGHAVIHALALRDAGGQPLRVIGAMQDVTETRRMQKQLERTQRVESLGRIAATMAHEFNNVLMGILPLAELLARSAEPDRSRVGAKIRDCVRRGKRVVDEILQISRIPEPVLGTFDLAQLLRQMRADIEASSGPAVDVTVDIPEPPVLIRGDREHVEQVVANLINNARDAMPSGGRLLVQLEERNDRALLTVADTGSGMTPEVLAHIFEPLFTTKRTGTGLGLAVSRRLLQQSGATIDVDSTVGRGTTFRIAFEAAGDPSSEAVRNAPHGEALARPLEAAQRRILVVEDNASVSDGIRLLLETEGFDIAIVERGAEAVDAVERSAPDIVLLDLSLSDADGVQVYDALASRWPDLPVIFMSGHAEASSLGGRSKQPNVGFIRKPFDLGALLACIERISGTGGGRLAASGP